VWTQFFSSIESKVVLSSLLQSLESPTGKTDEGEDARSEKEHRRRRGPEMAPRFPRTFLDLSHTQPLFGVGRKVSIKSFDFLKIKLHFPYFKINRAFRKKCLLTKEENKIAHPWLILAKLPCDSSYASISVIS
jgi:hypothetical protein